MKVFDWVLIALFAGQFMLWRDGGDSELDTVEFFKPDLVFRDVAAIEIKKGDDLLTLKKSGTQWELPAYGGYPTTIRAPESLIARLAGYFKGPVVGRGAKDARTNRVGEVNPYLRLRIRDTQGRVRSVYLSPAEGNSDFVHVDGDERVFRLEPGLSRQIDTNPAQWIDPILYQFNKAPYRFSFSMGGQEYKIGSDGRNYRWRNEILDTNKIISFFKGAARLPVDEPIGMADTSAGAFSPMTIFFELEEASYRVHLWHHMTQAGVTGFRVRVNDDPREAFVLAHRFGDLFKMGLARFMPDDRLPKGP